MTLVIKMYDGYDFSNQVYHGCQPKEDKGDTALAVIGGLLHQ